MSREQANEHNQLDLESGGRAESASGRDQANAAASEPQADRPKTSSGSLAAGASPADSSLSSLLLERRPRETSQQRPPSGPVLNFLAAANELLAGPGESPAKTPANQQMGQRRPGEPPHRARRRRAGCCQMFINPSGKVCYWWSAAVSVAFLYNFWFASFRYAFHEIDSTNWPVWLSMDLLAELVYWTDIVLNHKTGYLQDGVLQRNSKKISDHYRDSTQFHLDLLCILPLDILYLSFGFHSILRCNRLVKIYKFWSFVDRTERHTNYPNAFRICTLVHNILVIFHWNACIFQLISTNKLIDTEQLLKIEAAQCNDVTCKYLHAFYWSTLAIFGNLPAPRRRGEYVYVIAELIFGLILFAWVLGHVANIVTNVSAARKEFQARLDAVKTYMRTRRVSVELQTKVIRWFDYLWSSQMSSDEDRSVACLPDRLKAEIAIHVNLDTLKRVDIFQDTEVGFLRELVLRLKPVLFSPGDYVCRKDEAGHEMYIVSKGRLEVVTDTEAETRVVATFTAGSYFGEIAVLNVGAAGNKRTASVRSVGYSDLFCLSKQDLWDVLKDYPQAEARIRAVAEERLTALGGGGGKRATSNSKRARPNPLADSTSHNTTASQHRRGSQRSSKSRVQPAPELSIVPVAPNFSANDPINYSRRPARNSAGSQRMSSEVLDSRGRKCASSRTMEPIQWIRPPVVVHSASGCSCAQRQACHTKPQAHHTHQQHSRHHSAASVACAHCNKSQDADDQEFRLDLETLLAEDHQQGDTLGVFSASSPRRFASARSSSSQAKSVRGQRLLVQPLAGLGQSRSFECSPQGDASSAPPPPAPLRSAHRSRSSALAPLPSPAPNHPQLAQTVAAASAAASVAAFQLHVTASDLDDQLDEHNQQDQEEDDYERPIGLNQRRQCHHLCLHDSARNSLTSWLGLNQLRTRSSSVTTRPISGREPLEGGGVALEHQLSLDECRRAQRNSTYSDDELEENEASGVPYELAGWPVSEHQSQRPRLQPGARLKRHRRECRYVRQQQDCSLLSSSSTATLTSGGTSARPYGRAPLQGREHESLRQQQVVSSEPESGQARLGAEQTRDESETSTCRIEIEPELAGRKKRFSNP